MEDEILCYCYKVKKSEVFKFLQENNYNFNKLQNNLKIGTKCGACNADIEYWEFSDDCEKRVKRSN